VSGVQVPAPPPFSSFADNVECSLIKVAWRRQPPLSIPLPSEHCAFNIEH
jgi:hypothetical protein